MKWYSRVCESFSFCSKCSLFRIWICEQEAVCSQILDVISTHWSDFKNETMISIEGTLALFLRDVRAEWRYNIHKNWASSHLATISNNQKLRWLYFFFCRHFDEMRVGRLWGKTQIWVPTYHNYINVCILYIFYLQFFDHGFFPREVQEQSVKIM